MRRILLLFIILQTSGVFAQTSFLTSEERAYFFHIVRKNHIIDNIIGQYLTYSGDTVTLNTGEIDYDSLEHLIILEPTLLQIDFEGIKLSPQSILAEAASKMAIWKFMNILEDPEANSHRKDAESFMKLFRNNLPDVAFTSENRRTVLKNVLELVDPYMPFVEKRELLYEIKELSIQDMIDILKALDGSYKTYVYQLTLQYFDMIGGKLKAFSNTLLAAGEGSKTNGMMEEFDKNEEGKVEKTRPKGIGLYNYQYSSGKSQLRSNDLIVKSDPIVEYMGYKDPQNTSIHMSLWGFNAFFQTTVVIKSGNLSYVFYASRDTKQLSPDSTYYHGVTYRQHITELEEKIIPKLEDQLYGKNGYVNSKGRWKENMKYNEEKIRQAELDLRAFQTPHNKKYKKAQQRYLNYTHAYMDAKYRYQNIFKLIYEKERQLEYYKDQLYYMKSNIGAYVAEYELRDSIYYFEDGSTFNPYTQDFRFGKITDNFFAIRLISIGSKPLSRSVDEVQLLVNVIEKPKPFQIYLDLKLTDLFAVDGFELPKIPEHDTVQNRIDSLINYIARTNQPGLTALYGGGIGKKLDDGMIISDKKALEIKAYPGVNKNDRDKSRQSPEFKDLRSTNFSLFIDGTFNIHIVSYTDPVASSLQDSDSLIYNMMLKRWISGGNNMLSALRSFAMLESFINAVQHRLTERSDLSIKEINMINERLLQTKQNAIARVGEKWISYKDYEAIQSSSAKKVE